MENTQKKTGYPSIDKPWLKYYLSKPSRIIRKEQSLYDLVFESNRANMELAAIKYFSVTWTYWQLKEKIDVVANGFLNYGIHAGDIVSIGLSNTPEAIVALLALNKIGAVSKWFDVRATAKGISEYANRSHSKFLIAIDILIPEIISAIEATEIQQVFVVCGTDLLPAPIRLIQKIKGKPVSLPADKRFVRFWSLAEKGKHIDFRSITPRPNKYRPSIMIQSSGTTGKPKTIVHSDYSATMAIYSLSYSDLPIVKGKTLLNLLPPWIAYGLGEAILYPLAMGCTVILSPTFDPNSMMPYIGKFTIALAAPFHYRYLYEHFSELSKAEKEAFFQHVEGLVSGGDKITVQENKVFEEMFRTSLVNGYGNNEGWGCLTVNPIFHNEYGSVGIPKYGETVIAYDNEEQKELPYDKSGEICVNAGTTFLGYEGNPEETANVLRMHSDGQIWLHTGDIGKINTDGFVFLEGRTRRVIVRQGFKISAYTIEDKICELPEVKECVAVEVKDNDEEHVPIVFITVKENVNIQGQKVIEAIFDKCKRELKSYEVPKYIHILDKLPYTANGKYDFRTLEKEAERLTSGKQEM